MAKESLAVKYRPKVFEDMTEQSAIKDILMNQLETKTFQHGYLFTGPAGTGKTTSARIFANMINDGKGNPIEVDAASNSGVDNIRQIIEDAKRKPLDAEYKIFIIDECHSLSNGAWQALLKTLEEPPKFTIFILCTTDPQKIPNTILSRVQRYQFQKISNKGIVKRLEDICIRENSQDYDNPDLRDIGDIERFDGALDYIAKVSNGGMRDAITLLDKCLSLSHDISVENVLKTIGAEDYDTFFNFIFALVKQDKQICIDIIEGVYNSGKDVKQFLKDFSKFILDVEKYLIYNNTDYISIPATDENIKDLEELSEHRDEIFKSMDFIVNLNSQLKWENDTRTLTELSILIYCGG